MEKHSQNKIQVYMKSTLHHISLTQNCVLGQMPQSFVMSQNCFILCVFIDSVLIYACIFQYHKIISTQ